MKYIRQFTIILLLTLSGELCHALLPLPLPASIYGMIMLIFAFMAKLLHVEAVKEAGDYLVFLLPMLFVAPTVGLMGCMDLIRGNVVKIVILIVVTTVLTFGVAGLIAKIFGKGGEDDA